MHNEYTIFDAAMRLGKARDHIPGAPATADAIIAEMDEVGIADGLVWHADAQHSDAFAGNQQMMVEIADNPRLHPCWIFMPHETGEVPPPDIVVDAMLQANVRAARIFPLEHLFMLRLWNIATLLDCLTVHHIPLFIDFGVKGWSDENFDWDGIVEIGTAYPDLPLILTSVNISSDRRLIPLMKHFPNVYVETSYYTVHRGIELLVSAVGPERILFGSGLPQRAPGPALTALSYSLITDEEKKLVAGDNLRRLLNGVRS